jgi:hypothetical protein
MTQAGLSRPASRQTLLELATVAVLYALENGARDMVREMSIYIYLLWFIDASGRIRY